MLDWRLHLPRICNCSKTKVKSNDTKDESSSEEDAANPRKPQLEPRTFVMVDIPPFSTSLVAKMKDFMGEGSKLAAMLVTSRDAIHYDEGRGNTICLHLFCLF